MLKPFNMKEVEALFEQSSFKDYLKNKRLFNEATNEDVNDDEEDSVESETDTEENTEYEDSDDSNDSEDSMKEDYDDDMENMREAVINFVSLNNRDFLSLKESDPELFDELVDTCKYICKL